MKPLFILLIGLVSIVLGVIINDVIIQPLMQDLTSKLDVQLGTHTAEAVKPIIEAPSLTPFELFLIMAGILGAGAFGYWWYRKPKGV